MQHRLLILTNPTSGPVTAHNMAALLDGGYVVTMPANTHVHAGLLDRARLDAACDALKQLYTKKQEG